MEMQIRLEGTAEEISQALQALSSTGVLHATASELADDVTADTAEAAPADTDTDIPVVTTRFARRALTRRRLSKPMRKVLKALYEAHPDWLPLPALHKVAGYRPPQFAGLMGAFGRRMANTEGYDSEAYFFVYRWNDDEGTWDYRLPDSVREALELEELI